MSGAALLIVDHGSRLPEAHAHLERVAEQVRRREPGRIVHIAHMEAATPSLEQGIDACVRDGAEEIAVHPFFLVPGRHLTRDIPALVESAAKRHPRVRVRITPALGEAAEIAELILKYASG